MKSLAVICNYTLNPLRIGGMDRFFVAYNEACKEKGWSVKWFFSGGTKFEFYKGLDIEFCESNSVENYFIEYQIKYEPEFNSIVTHFIELCTPFFKKIKHSSNPYIIAVDHNPRPFGGFPLKKRLKNKIKSKLYSKYINKFVGVSEYAKLQILNDYGSKLAGKTTVIHNGIEVNQYFKKTETNHGKFIVASHLRPSKGIQDLIAAIHLLNAELIGDLRIDIFGEGPMEAELKMLVQEKRLEKQIRFCGSSPDLPELFQNYSYLLQPTYMECFSLSILESLSANVPVITTPVGGNLEVITNGENGYIFETSNIKELSKIISDILQHKKAIETEVYPLIENKYYLEKMVNEHLGLLDA